MRAEKYWSYGRIIVIIVEQFGDDVTLPRGVEGDSRGMLGRAYGCFDPFRESMTRGPSLWRGREWSRW